MAKMTRQKEAAAAAVLEAPAAADVLSLLLTHRGFRMATTRAAATSQLAVEAASRQAEKRLSQLTAPYLWLAAQPLLNLCIPTSTQIVSDRPA